MFTLLVSSAARLSLDTSESEASLVAALCAHAKFFHVRKPGADRYAIELLISKIPAALLDHVTIHAPVSTAREVLKTFPCGGIHVPLSDLKEAHGLARRLSTSIHRQHELAELTEEVSYAFFGPVWPSISKIGYMPTYRPREIRDITRQSPVPLVAIGGVDETRIAEAQSLGFSGVAVLGALWREKSPIAYCRRICAAVERVSVRAEEQVSA